MTEKKTVEGIIQALRERMMEDIEELERLGLTINRVTHQVNHRQIPAGGGGVMVDSKRKIHVELSTVPDELRGARWER